MIIEPLNLAFTEVGQEPRLVVLHGLLGRARNWLSIARSLEERHGSVLVDLRNHGSSPWSDDASYAAMAADVAALIERLGDAVTVIGHSMGGKVAMVLALTQPELVRRLVVVDMAPVAYRRASLGKAVEIAGRKILLRAGFEPPHGKKAYAHIIRSCSAPFKNAKPAY